MRMKIVAKITARKIPVSGAFSKRPKNHPSTTMIIEKILIRRMVLLLFLVISSYMLREIYVWCFLSFIRSIKEISFLESESVCDQISWEDLKFDVKIAHYAVIKASCCLYFIFCICEFLLKMKVISYSLKRRIIFCHSKKRFECLC